MNESVFAQVYPFHRLAVDYVAAKFDVGEEAASGVVRSVLAGLFLEGGKTLGNPKRFLLRTCRWKAMKTLRRHGRRAPEVLIALEDEDRGKFFGTASGPGRDHREPMVLSTTVEVPGSIVRVNVRVSRPDRMAG